MIKTLIRVILTGICVFIVIRLVKWDEFFTLLGRLDVTLYAISVIAILLPIVFLSIRWQIILGSQGIVLEFPRTFVINYAGMFFNNFLPGSIGGDIAKAIVVSKDEKRKAICVATVILDRLIGLVALFLIAFIAALVNLANLTNEALITPITFIFVTILVFYIGYRIYFSRTIRTSAFLGRIKDILPFKDTLKELDGVFKNVRSRKKLLIFTLLFSILTQASMIIIIYIHSVSLSVKNVQLVHFFMFMPIIFLVMSIPITVGGWGLQEISFATLFLTVSADKNEMITLSVLYHMSMVFISIPGAILFAAGFAKKQNEKESRST